MSKWRREVLQKVSEKDLAFFDKKEHGLVLRQVRHKVSRPLKLNTAVLMKKHNIYNLKRLKVEVKALHKC